VDELEQQVQQRTAELSEVNNLLKQEIAHRRRAEEANATFAAIVEHSNDAIIGTKLDGTIVTWNFGASTDLWIHRRGSARPRDFHPGLRQHR
jgi:PAS domain-containing protein